MDVNILLTFCGIALPVLGGLVTWIMNGFNTRLTNVENQAEHLQDKKLDKEHYYRDQGAMNENMRVMSTDIKEIARAVQEWPEKLINILTQAGKL